MKKISSLIIAVILIISANISVSALPTPFVTDPFTDEKMTTFIENVPVEKIEGIDWTKPIKSFDVNEDEMILLLFNRSDEYAVCVYNSDFEFQYGFSFNSYGTVACEWSGNDIMVFFVRGDIYAKLDANGNWVEINDIPYSPENNKLSSYLLYNKSEVVVKNTTYRIQNDMGVLNLVQSANSYSQLIKIDENNNETILYDINHLQTTRTILVLIFIIGLVSTFLVTLLKSITQETIKNKKK